MSKNITKGNIWNRFIYFLEPIPEKFGYSLGATPIGSAVAHPIERKSTKGRREVEADDKEEVDGHEV
jgi:hypothetical protein